METRKKNGDKCPAPLAPPLSPNTNHEEEEEEEEEKEEEEKRGDQLECVNSVDGAWQPSDRWGHTHRTYRRTHGRTHTRTDTHTHSRGHLLGLHTRATHRGGTETSRNGYRVFVPGFFFLSLSLSPNQLPVLRGYRVSTGFLSLSLSSLNQIHFKGVEPRTVVDVDTRVSLNSGKGKTRKKTR